MYVNQGPHKAHTRQILGSLGADPMLSSGASSGATPQQLQEQRRPTYKAAVVKVFGPQPGVTFGQNQNLLGNVSSTDYLAVGRLNLIASGSFRFWIRYPGSYRTNAADIKPYLMDFKSVRDPRFAFYVAHIQKLAGLPSSGIIDRKTLSILLALGKGDPYQQSWAGRWCRSNVVGELGRDGAYDHFAMLIADLPSYGKYDTNVSWRDQVALADKVNRACVEGRLSVPAIQGNTAQVISVARTCQRNLELALRDIWWVTPQAVTPESFQVYSIISDYMKFTGRFDRYNARGLAGAAEPEIMRLIKTHTVESSRTSLATYPFHIYTFKDTFLFPYIVGDLPSDARLVCEFLGRSTNDKNKIMRTDDDIIKANNDIETIRRNIEKSSQSNADEIKRRLEEEARRPAEEARRREEEARRQEEQRKAEERQKQEERNRRDAQARAPEVEKLKVKVKVLNDGAKLLNDKKRLDAPLVYYLAEIEKILLAIPAGMRPELLPDIKAALTAHLYSIMPHLKAGSPEAAARQAEKDRIAAEVIAKIKAEADAIAAAEAERKAKADADAAAAAAEAERLRLEAEASAKAAQEAADLAARQQSDAAAAEAQRQAEAAAAEAKRQADAAAAEAQRLANEQAAAAEAERKAREASAKVEEARNDGANGASAEDVISKGVEAVNEITGGSGGAEIAKEVIDIAVSDDPSKKEAAKELTAKVEATTKSGGGGGLIALVGLAAAGYFLFGRRR